MKHNHNLAVKSYSTQVAQRSLRGFEGGKKRPNYALRRVGAAAMAAGLVFGGVKVADKLVGNSGPIASNAPRDEYIVDHGETPFDIAKLVEANHDGVAGNEDIRPFVDDIVNQASKDGVPGLQAGERIQLIEAADVNPDVRGIQLR